MSELGETLRKARLKKNLSLDDIQNKTKIQKRYLEAIEEGNLDLLPGHFYARAFAKSYAEAVDLDPDEILGQVKTELPAPPSVEQIQPLRRTRQSKPTIQPGRWLSRVLLYLFAVLILFVIYIAVSQFDQGTNDEAKQPAPAESIAPPEVEQGQPAGQNPASPAPVNPAVTPEQKAQPAGAELRFLKQENNIYRYELSGAPDIVLSITAANGNCWLRVLKGGQNGEKVDELTLNKGNAKEWTLKGTSEAWVRLGSAPDVKITVNGKALDTSIMKRQSQIISISLKP